MCGTVDCPAGKPACGAGSKASGGCLYNLREDPHETKNIAAELPDVVTSLRNRYLELKATAIDQRTPLMKMQAATVKYFPNWIKMLQNNRGFIGPWCTDGACSPAAAEAANGDTANAPIELPYMMGGEFPGMKPYGADWKW